MGRKRMTKITVEIPADILDRARRDGEGVTEVVRSALELRAGQQAWQRLQRWSGKVTWSIDLKELRED